MTKLTRGILVTFEGIECCGKTTLAQQLAQELRADFDLIFTKESGGTTAGERMHEIVQYQQTPLDPKTEFLLFAADRAQHVAEIVAPALAQKKLVLCDRMADSSVMYQGYGRGLDIGMVERINAWAMANRQPDITFFLKIDTVVAHERLVARKGKLSTFETERAAFMTRIAQGYEKYFADKKRVRTLDGMHTPQELAHETRTILLNWLKKNKIIQK